MGEVYNMDGSKPKEYGKTAQFIGKFLGIWTLAFLFWVIFYSTKYVAAYALDFLGITL